jgi:glycerol-3-phosphate acyltransferase PlsY
MPPIETAWTLLAVWAVAGYLLGSVPFGMVITRVFGLGDLRAIGSGNIGATNVLRTGSKSAAAATLILDSGKGAAAVLLARALAGEDAAQIAGLAAFLGHCFPVWLKFNGGKGVATFLGTLLALAWPLGLAACATWLATAAVTRISSLAALVAAALSPLWAVLLDRGEVAALAGALALVVLWRHGDNIARIRAGTEPRIGRKRDD